MVLAVFEAWQCCQWQWNSYSCVARQWPLNDEGANSSTTLICQTLSRYVTVRFEFLQEKPSRMLRDVWHIHLHQQIRYTSNVFEGHMCGLTTHSRLFAGEAPTQDIHGYILLVCLSCNINPRHIVFIGWYAKGILLCFKQSASALLSLGASGSHRKEYEAYNSRE